MIGLLCPGQGSQFVGMGKELAESFPTARAVFEEADEALGMSLSNLCWEGTADELTLTVNAQPAILVHTVAVWRILQEERPLAVGIAAGHSLGEFSAHVTAGTLTFADAVKIVRRRGELMHESGTQRPGTMAAILGLDDANADSICARATSESGATVVPANYNAPGQIVISGDQTAVEKAGELARERGAKRVIPLNVSGAFHSPLMDVAVAGLQSALDSATFQDPAFPVVSNVSAEPVVEASAARELLIQQLTSPVRWVDSIQRMVSLGASEFIEIGPGNVLSGLVRRIDRSIPTRALGQVTDMEAYLQDT